MKTATTTIQAWLKDNEAWLAERGWIYPGWPLRVAPLFASTLQKLPLLGSARGPAACRNGQQKFIFSFPC